MKKKKRLKKEVAIGLIIVSTTTLLISSIMIIKNTKNFFIGKWISEGGIIYEFKRNNSGIMKTPLSEYKFTYKVSDKIISINFEDEKNIDTNYEYSFENNKCIMKSDRGLFTFTNIS